MKTVLVLIAAVLLCGGVCAADEIQGKIEGVDAAAKTISISGVTVAAGDAQLVKDLVVGIPFSDLAAGNYVIVKGDFSGPAKINARKISMEIVRNDVIKIKGPVEKADAAARTLVISGINVSVPPYAKVEDAQEGRASVFTPGNYVECEGKWTGPAAFTAKEVKAENPED